MTETKSSIAIPSTNGKKDEKARVPYSKEEIKELKAIDKNPLGNKKRLLEAFSSKYKRGFSGVNAKFYTMIKKTEKKKKKVKVIAKKKKKKEPTPGQKSAITRKKYKLYGGRHDQRKFHDSPTKELQVGRNQLRFPYKAISIEGGEVVVTF